MKTLVFLLVTVLILQQCFGFAPSITRIVLHRGIGGSYRPHSRSQQVVELFLFGDLFGDDTKKKNAEQLALYDFNDVGSSSFDSLVEYIQQWATLLTGLTTPVKLRNVRGTDAAGVQILFQHVQQTGYGDKDSKKQDADDKKDKAPNKSIKKQGGVEVLVEKLDNDAILQVRASRCEMDEDTMIKEMSEETILNELSKAMDVWKKQHVS